MPTSTDIVPARPEWGMPTERLESEITTLAVHIHAATARWLALVAEYDRRMAWADWDCKSCAHWLSWGCSLGMRAAREHLRVARSLVDLPLIRREFGRNDVSCDETAHLLLRRGWLFRDQGTPLARGRRRDREGVERDRGPAGREGCSAEPLEEEQAVEVLEELGEQAFSTPGLDQRDARAVQEQEDARQRFFDSQLTSDYARRRADALVALAEGALTGLRERTSNGDRYQVMVHVDAATLANDDLLGRSELDGGPSLPPETIRRLGCDRSILTTTEKDGEILDVGRKTRSIPTAVKRALIERDRHCRFLGCTSKVWVDGHHVRHWGHGGETKLSNLVLVCRSHHRALHEYGS